MARLIFLLLSAAVVQAGTSASIQFSTVPKAEIERRLASFEDTNYKRELRLRAMFEEAGCVGDKLDEQRVKHAKAPNVFCTLAGSTEAVILVGGHFDFVDRGRGVVDNWSGCSLLPSLFSDLQTAPRRHTFVFVGFTDEERGLIGSQFYIGRLGKEELKEISAMVNLDSLGTSETKLELDRGDKKLANALHLVALHYNLPLSVVNLHRVGRSDSDSFQDRRVPAISIHSLSNETFPILHTY